MKLSIWENCLFASPKPKFSKPLLRQCLNRIAISWPKCFEKMNFSIWENAFSQWATSNLSKPDGRDSRASSSGAGKLFGIQTLPPHTSTIPPPAHLYRLFPQPAPPAHTSTDPRHSHTPRQTPPPAQLDPPCAPLPRTAQPSLHTSTDPLPPHLYTSSFSHSSTDLPLPHQPKGNVGHPGGKLDIDFGFRGRRVLSQHGTQDPDIDVLCSQIPDFRSDLGHNIEHPHKQPNNMTAFESDRASNRTTKKRHLFLRKKFSKLVLGFGLALIIAGMAHDDQQCHVVGISFFFALKKDP